MFNWQGACMGIRAQQTVTGLQQAKAYSGYSNIPRKPIKSSFCFHFGSNQHTSVGYIPVGNRMRDEETITHRVDIVNLTIPFLIRVDTLTK